MLIRSSWLTVLTSSISLLIFCLVILSGFLIYSIEISKYNYELSVSHFICQFWLNIVQDLVVKWVCIYNCRIFLIHWPFYVSEISLFVLENISCPKVHLSDISMDTAAHSWSLFSWYMYFQLLTFNLHVLLNLKYVFCRQHKVGSLLSLWPSAVWLEYLVQWHLHDFLSCWI